MHEDFNAKELIEMEKNDFKNRIKIYWKAELRKILVFTASWLVVGLIVVFLAHNIKIEKPPQKTLILTAINKYQESGRLFRNTSFITVFKTSDNQIYKAYDEKTYTLIEIGTQVKAIVLYNPNKDTGIDGYIDSYNNIQVLNKGNSFGKNQIDFAT